MRKQCLIISIICFVIAILISVCAFATGFVKVDGYTIQKSEVVSTPKTATYDYKFLLDQKKRIEADMVSCQTARQKELDEVNSLIAEAIKLGLKERPVVIDVEMKP